MPETINLDQLLRDMEAATTNMADAENARLRLHNQHQEIAVQLQKADDRCEWARAAIQHCVERQLRYYQERRNIAAARARGGESAARDAAHVAEQERKLAAVRHLNG